MPAKVRVLVVDDHRLFAEALKMLLAGEEDLEIQGVVGTGKEAVEMVGRTPPDVVLMDMELPGMGGIEATRRIRELSPETQVVVITAYQEPAQIAAAASAGACGFLLKTEAADELIHVIRRAAAGEIVLPHKRFRSALGKRQAVEKPRSEAPPLADQLTSREVQILQAMADGASTRELADRLLINHPTVQSHVKNILAKLGVHSKLEAVTFGLRHGVVRIRRNGEGTG